MSAPARLGLFAAALAVIGGGAALAGAAVGGGTPAAVQDAEMAMEAMGPEANGLAAVAGGYSFVPAGTTLTRGRSLFRFRIVDEHGRAAHDFDPEGGVRLHLIVARRDLTGYRHVHPALLPDGSWSVSLDLPAPGAYRAFADFETGGRKVVLGHDLFVAGPFAPRPLPAPRLAADADGFAVRLSHAPLRAGREAELRFDVARDGRPVPAFDLYVGHRGHLVALRDGDLAYSHVHPHTGGAPGEISFDAEFPSEGRYRLFLQFKVDGAVHTAPFTVEVPR